MRATPSQSRRAREKSDATADRPASVATPSDLSAVAGNLVGGWDDLSTWFDIAGDPEEDIYDPWDYHWYFSIDEYLVWFEAIWFGDVTVPEPYGDDELLSDTFDAE